MRTGAGALAMSVRHVWRACHLTRQDPFVRVPTRVCVARVAGVSTILSMTPTPQLSRKRRFFIAVSVAIPVVLAIVWGVIYFGTTKQEKPTITVTQKLPPNIRGELEARKRTMNGFLSLVEELDSSSVKMIDGKVLGFTPQPLSTCGSLPAPVVRARGRSYPIASKWL